MTVIIFLAAAALLMTELYSRTRHPKSYAFLNSAAGIAVLLLVPFFMEGALPQVNIYGAAMSAVLGAPGAALYIILPELI